ncbi:MAG: alginate O-acetyltransferase AlgX-related protein [Fusobacteriaceae bacterium]
MKKEQNFLISLIISILLITGLNYIIYINYNSEYTGDIGNLAKIDFGKKYNQLFKYELENEKYYVDYNSNIDTYDIITIGDSFSQQQENGYQNHLSKLSNKKIMNLQRLPSKEPEQTAFILLNSGYFDKVKTKYLIIESVERAFLPRGIAININEKDNLEKIELDYQNLEKTHKKNIKDNSFNFFNLSNFKFLVNKILYKINDRAFYTKIYKKTLKVPMFSLREKELYFYSDDLKNLKYNTKDNMSLTNENLNILNQKLTEKGIQLVVMPAINKYTFYQDYITDDKIKKSYFFEEYSKENKNYMFINTKDILVKSLLEEKDIFYLNDTHWSYKAAIKVAENLNKNLKF